MSHFARLENGVVVQVIVAEQSFIDTLEYPHEWVQTSYNSNIRGKFAAIGDKYDNMQDVFVSPFPAVTQGHSMNGTI